MPDTAALQSALTELTSQHAALGTAIGALAVPENADPNPNDCSAELAFKQAANTVRDAAWNIAEAASTYASAAEGVAQAAQSVSDAADLIYAECVNPS